MNMPILEVHRCESSLSLRCQHVFGPKAFFVCNRHVFREKKGRTVSHMQLTPERNSHMSPGGRQEDLGVSGRSARVSVMWLTRLGLTGNSSLLEAVSSLSKVAPSSKRC